VAKMDDILADLCLASRGSHYRRLAWKSEALRKNVRGGSDPGMKLACFQIGLSGRKHYSRMTKAYSFGRNKV
jgi:hypothetical protein